MSSETCRAITRLGSGGSPPNVANERKLSGGQSPPLKEQRMLGKAQRCFALCGERPKALPLETASL